jgi:hypothetical protein
MDVYGKEPADKTGEYVRYSVWNWHPLADYLLATAPAEITGACKFWHTNDGDGLGAERAKALADFLTGEIDSGRAEDYVEMRNASLESLADLPCEVCEGTGRRDDPILRGECNLCGGTGKVRPPEAAYYRSDFEEIVRFRDFLRTCGGFTIH